MYTSTFSDWFCQAVIDFMLGNRTITVFSEFLLKLKSTDPRDLIRLSKIRAEAIATSVSRVLPEGERLLSGWTMFAPEELNVKIGIKFEEKVLLLVSDLYSGVSFYSYGQFSRQRLSILWLVQSNKFAVSSELSQSYDYTLEKVKIYTRVPLGDIIRINKGKFDYFLGPSDDQARRRRIYFISPGGIQLRPPPKRGLCRYMAILAARVARHELFRPQQP